VAWDATTDGVWVACATGELVSLPAAGGDATTSSTIERDLRDVIVNNGSLSVTEFRSAQLLRVANGGTITRRDILPAQGPFLPHVAWRAVPGPSGSVVVAHQEHSIQNIQTDIPGGYGQGPAAGAVESQCTVMGSDGTVLSTVSMEAVLPVDVAVSPDATFAAVVGAGDSFAANLASLTIVPLDVSGSSGFNGFDSGDPLPPTDPALLGPDASLISPGPIPSPAPGFGMQTMVHLPLGNQAIAVAFDGNGNVLVQTREPASLWVVPIPAQSFNALAWPVPASPISLSSVTRDDTGHDIFHTSAGALIACASCHPEGGDDSHVWVLDGNQRRTPSLRGTIAGTAPYHWPGDEPDLPTLTHDVYNTRMSGQLLDPGQTTALESWVEAIPAPPPPSWIDRAAAARGKAIFAQGDAACATCHSGPKLTNNQTLNVGTGQAFQVPPLVGVGWRAPLLHDGCAATVADRFSITCSTVGHGNISSLMPQDISDLTMYLESL
jgi:cytochrome c553